MMMRIKLIHSLALVALVLAAPSWGQVVLISPIEAALPEAKTSSNRGIARGPSIRMASPIEVNAASFALKIALQARDGSKIDPESIHIEYLKDPLIDLTSRIQHDVSERGISIDNASVPQGQHHLRVAASDTEGRQTVYLFKLTAR